MVLWELCPSCRKVVDEFESQCGWCFPKSETESASNEKQMMLFDLKKINLENKDYSKEDSTPSVCNKH